MSDFLPETIGATKIGWLLRDSSYREVTLEFALTDWIILRHFMDHETAKVLAQKITGHLAGLLSVRHG